jgi:hypothetical protein
MAVNLLALRAGRLLSPGRLLVLISLRDWVRPRATVELEGLGQTKNPMTSLGIEPATFQLATCCLNQLRYLMPLLHGEVEKNSCRCRISQLGRPTDKYFTTISRISDVTANRMNTICIINWRKASRSMFPVWFELLLSVVLQSSVLLYPLEVVLYSETSVAFYRNTWRYVPLWEPQIQQDEQKNFDHIYCVKYNGEVCPVLNAMKKYARVAV